MQFAATIIYSTGPNILSKKLFNSQEDFLFVRNLGESSGNFYKILSGYLSDKINNRKLFLYLGYGAMIFCKLMFWFVTFDYLAQKWLALIFIIVHSLDRFLNSIRDAPRDALLFASTDKKDIVYAFAIRKLIGSIGSVVGGFFCIIVMLYTNIVPQVLYGIPILPIFI